jgi:mono/diheme cytochrome c family protein
VDAEEKEAGMKLMLALLTVGLVGGWQEAQKPAEEKATAETKTADAGKLVNPLKATPESIALGKKAYGSDCAMCHGKEGAGDGDLAVDMKLKLKDYRDATALKDLTDGDIYNIILNGKGQMTGEEGRMKATQIWNVVNYVRALSKSKT